LGGNTSFQHEFVRSEQVGFWQPPFCPAESFLQPQDVGKRQGMVLCAHAFRVEWNIFCRWMYWRRIHLHSNRRYRLDGDVPSCIRGTRRSHICVIQEKRKQRTTTPGSVRRSEFNIYVSTFLTQNMDQAESNVSVTVTVGEVKVQFSGTADSVMASVMNFLSKQVPAMDLGKKISLVYTTPELIETYSKFIKITQEGPRVIPDSDVSLSDKDMVALQLVAMRIAKDLGKVQDDAMQVADIHATTALNPKSISSRISEMVKAGHVSRDEKETGKYRITTAGIHWLNSTIAKKFKAS